MAGAAIFGTSELKVRLGMVAIQIIVESEIELFICLFIIQSKFELCGTGDCDLLRKLNGAPDIILQSCRMSL